MIPPPMSIDDIETFQFSINERPIIPPSTTATTPIADASSATRLVVAWSSAAVL